MTTGNEITRRLTAWSKGRPIYRGSKLRLRSSSVPDVLIAAFVKMGGESAPWGDGFWTPERDTAGVDGA
jgi:hypothetical protein